MHGQMEKCLLSRKENREPARVKATCQCCKVTSATTLSWEKASDFTPWCDKEPETPTSFQRRKVIPLMDLTLGTTVCTGPEEETMSHKTYILPMLKHPGTFLFSPI